MLIAEDCIGNRERRVIAFRVIDPSSARCSRLPIAACDLSRLPARFPRFMIFPTVKKEASGMCASGSRPPTALFLPPDHRVEERNLAMARRHSRRVGEREITSAGEEKVHRKRRKPCKIAPILSIDCSTIVGGNSRRNKRGFYEFSRQI